MALVPMFAGYVLFGLGLARVRASMATTISLAETVVAAVLAVVVVGERLPAMAWVGAALVAGSLFVLTLPAPKRRYARAAEIPPADGRPVPATRTRA
jgi:DME family drug/metabolite transporter